ncbi:sensor histidine kinase [Demequina pelophila]|uniref:sensor histidine kinase n=1 Tax=Demequina pelophila TaxID=1638984 RepID=UPI0007824032|nr:HAMP domain-containing sensor histidine kinase [Demequina pelophila]
MADASPRRGVSVRTRILAAVLALTALALAVSGFVAASIQDAQVIDRIGRDLASDVSEFEQLLSVGVDPSTGQPFAAPSDALRTSMQRVIPKPNEGVIGFIDGELAYLSREAVMPLEDDPEFIDEVTPLTTADDVSYARVSTTYGNYQVAVVPVRATVDGELVVGTAGNVDADVPVAAEVLAYDEDAELAEFRRAFAIYAWVALAAFVVVAVVAWLFAGRLLRPIRVLAAAARSIGREDISERIPVTGTDDLADMTDSVNQMLGRMETAFASQMALLDDVSHELRTPITVLRGHLELMDPADPADAREVRDLSLDELERMSRLVEDLMTLAKSERPDFIQARPTDLGPLTEAVLAKARGLGEREWMLDATADAVVAVDPQRVTQAWLQLAANAVRFSTAGSQIGLGASIDGDRVRLWVRDQGEGVPAEHQQRIFDRFQQATSSSGSGLGLTIVSAIAAGHGGTVELESAVGIGSRFTIVLPVTATSHQEARA